MRRSILCVILLLSIVRIAAAQTLPSNVLLGTLIPSAAETKSVACGVQVQGAMFQHSGIGPATLTTTAGGVHNAGSFSAANVFNGFGYDYYGSATFTFNAKDPSSGVLGFDYSLVTQTNGQQNGTAPNPSFTDYVQDYVKGKNILNLTFTISFPPPLTCSLPVTGIFHVPTGIVVFSTTRNK